MLKKNAVLFFFYAYLPGITILFYIVGTVGISNVLSPSFIMSIFQVPLPFEDAAMLFRYANNFANGYGIVWNSGDSPQTSDGATDLGFVLVLYPLIKLGLGSSGGALLLNICSLILLSINLYKMNQRVWHLSKWSYLLVLTILSLFIWSAVAAGFSAAIFGSLLLVVFMITYKQIYEKTIFHTTLVDRIFLGTMIGMCGWWRPEGFVLAPFVFLATYFMEGSIVLAKYKRRSREVFLYLSQVGLTIGFVCLLWIVFRLTYFEQLLPTSAIVKFNSLDLLSLDLLRKVMPVLMYYSYSLLPFWLLVFFMVLVRHHLRRILPIGVIVLLSSLLWVPLNPTLNWWGRHWWPLSPFLIAWSLTFLSSNLGGSHPHKRAHNYFSNLITGIDLRKARMMRIILVLLVVLGFFTSQEQMQRRWGDKYFKTNFTSSVYYQINRMDTSEVRLATTEAGLIPLAMPQGQVLDTWVHNTRAIALRGPTALTSVLSQFEPNLIVVHGTPPTEFRSEEPCESPFSADWGLQTKILYNYAKQNNFRLVRSDLSASCETWNIFVSDSLPIKLRKVLSTQPPPKR